MKRLGLMLSILVFGILDSEEWIELPKLPSDQGVAGAFAGVSGGALLVAGGANFPVRPPWENGEKVWHDEVYLLERSDGEWKRIGRLPRPLGYGVSVTHGDSVVCVGGSDSVRHHAEAFRLWWREGRLVLTELPPLPTTLANGSGALLGGVLYIAGGQIEPDSVSATKKVYAIDLSDADPVWKPVEECPGPARMLAASGSADGAFWLVGGVELVPSEGKPTRGYLKDAYGYDPGVGWTRLADLPHPVAAAPSPAPAVGSSILILGGDDGANAGFRPPQDHPGFSRLILRYDAEKTRWVESGRMPAPRVTVPIVAWQGRWVLPSGEVRPGVRSAQVWAFLPRAGD